MVFMHNIMYIRIVWKELYCTNYYYGANRLRESITHSGCPMATREIKSNQLHQFS